MINSLKALLKDEDGPTTVEYALMLVLVSIVAIGAWTVLGGNVRTQAQGAADVIGSVPVPTTGTP